MLETLTITLAALVASLVLFSMFMFLIARVRPSELIYWMYIGGFGTSFSWQNTLTRAAPLILAALCTALPARLGLIVIGGEGALALGGLAAAEMALVLHNLPSLGIQLGMAVGGMIAGGLLIALCGALRHWRGVNATISSLLLAYCRHLSFSIFSSKDRCAIRRVSTSPRRTPFLKPPCWARCSAWTCTGDWRTAWRPAC